MWTLSVNDYFRSYESTKTDILILTRNQQFQMYHILFDVIMFFFNLWKSVQPKTLLLRVNTIFIDFFPTYIDKRLKATQYITYTLSILKIHQKPFCLYLLIFKVSKDTFFFIFLLCALTSSQ